MAQIVPAGQFNPASLTADDLYISVQNPPGFIRGAPTDVIGIVGTASWGPVNTPVHMGSPHDALVAFGAIGAAALTDPFDLATDLAIAFGQAQSQATLEGWAVRVTDGTDVAASSAIPGAASSAAITATLSGTITNGDTCSLTFTSSALTGSPITITRNVVTADTLNSIAAYFVAQINANAALKAAGVYATASGAVISIYQPTALSPQVVVTRTSGATETITLGTGAASTAGLTLSGIYTGILGNGLTCQIQNGAASNTFTAILALPAIGAQEIYPNLPAAGFWAALATAINSGLSNVRGPSGIAKASNANGAIGNPTLATTTLSGGLDGRAAVVTATLLGSDTASPRTGLYALRQLQPAVGVVWLVGCTDATAWASLLSFGQTEGAAVLAPFATGTTTAAAISAVQANGIHDPAFTYVKDWIYWFDAINNLLRLSPPTAFIGGKIAGLAPEINPGNEPVSMVIGTERYAPSGVNPYTLSEIGQLASAGIMVITNPIPAGQQWGIRVGQTTSLNAATAGVEWWRMSMFLARSFASSLGQFVDQNQSQLPNDPLRNAVKNQLNTFLQGLGARIDGFSVICTLSLNPSAQPGNGINTPASIAQHYLFVLVKVTYLSSVRFFVLTLQGGTTVVTIGATPGQQQQ